MTNNIFQSRRLKKSKSGIVSIIESRLDGYRKQYNGAVGEKNPTLPHCVLAPWRVASPSHVVQSAMSGSSYKERFMDGEVGDGNAFAIPDLWKPSILAHFDELAADSIASGLEPLSMDLLLRI